MTSPPAPRWRHPPDLVRARRDEVHVWRARLDVSPASVERLRRVLSADERERAGRFRFPRDAASFVVSRVFLRLLLGRYLSREPDQLRLSYGPYGKPFLPDEGEGGLRFNLSHCPPLALYAIACGREVGVDAEAVRGDMDFGAVAERFFSPQEAALLRSLPDGERATPFFIGWTRKEAYLKARGDGLAGGLTSAGVPLIPERPASRFTVHGEPGDASRWSLMELDPGPGYVAALAVEGRDWRLRCWQLPADMTEPPRRPGPSHGTATAPARSIPPV